MPTIAAKVIQSMHPDIGVKPSRSATRAVFKEGVLSMPRPLAYLGLRLRMLRKGRPPAIAGQAV
jgi:hypothetical protein